MHGALVSVLCHGLNLNGQVALQINQSQKSYSEETECKGEGV